LYCDILSVFPFIPKGSGIVKDGGKSWRYLEMSFECERFQDALTFVPLPLYNYYEAHNKGPFARDDGRLGVVRSEFKRCLSFG